MASLLGSIEGRDIVSALGGSWSGRNGMCRCPAHKDKSPSLHVTENNGCLLLYCFAGCEFREIVSALSAMGLWDDMNRERQVFEPVRPIWDDSPTEDDTERLERALEIWGQSFPIVGTLGEAYLRKRHIRGSMPRCLRFHPALAYPRTGELMPAMVAGVEDRRGDIIAIQRTFMRPDGTKLPKDMVRKFSLAPMMTGAVRLRPLDRVRETLGWAEGIETAMSAMDLYAIPTWASLGTARLAKGNIYVPPQVENIIIFADNGDAGHRASRRASAFFRSMGLVTEIIYPPAGIDDFNDLAASPECMGIAA